MNERYVPQAEDAVRTLLKLLGQDVAREGLRETPRRVVKMLQEMCNQEPFAFTSFDAEGLSDMVVQTNIPFASLCAHHMLPFMGTACVAYIPDKKIVGLSKLARAVHYCAKGLQTQEHITREIADMLEQHISPIGVGVVLRAQHTCMSLRGIKAHDSWTITSELRGVLRNEASARAEFLSLARG